MVTTESVLSLFKGSIRRGVALPPLQRPLSFKEIAYLLGVRRSGVKALKRVLTEMLHNGLLVMTRKGIYAPSEELNLIIGCFEAHKGGYGFVVPEKAGTPDLFVPARAALGAMNGDRVIARVENQKKRQGRIIRILKRAVTRVAGRLDVTKTGCFVMPKNKAIAFDIYIPPKDRQHAKDGDMVLAEIVSYPTENRQPTGKILKVIERPEDPRSDIEAIIAGLNLPKRFPMDVYEEAKLACSRQTGTKRKDLRHLLTVTIDGERAKDFDDAISIKLRGHGYVLYVHIADVGFYVDWDTPLDIEARNRATSIYFPDRAIPMLPPELSEDLCSLKPGVERPALTVEMHFNRQGDRESARFYPSLIQSNERMTYTSTRKIIIDGDMAERQRYGYLLKELELMAELAGALRAKRQQRGSLDFDLPEPEVLLDLRGRPEAILKAERNFAHVMIEEFMISANEAVGEHMQALGIPCLYRIHEPPDLTKQEEIWRLIKPLLRGGNDPARKGSMTPAKKGSMTPAKKGAMTPLALSKILSQIKGTPEEEVINYIVLRGLKQARYSHQNLGHFGLASKCYTHFTSPIRRYPDLVVHRILREAQPPGTSKTSAHAGWGLSDRRIKELEAVLPEIAAHSSYMERLSDEAEKEVLNAMRSWFMKDKVGDEFKGKIVGVTPYGIKIRLEDFYVEGFLHVSYMTDDFYVYNEQSLTLKGRNTKKIFRIGQELMVRIDRVDMDEREIVFGRV